MLEERELELFKHIPTATICTDDQVLHFLKVLAVSHMVVHVASCIVCKEGAVAVDLLDFSRIEIETVNQKRVIGQKAEFFQAVDNIHIVVMVRMHHIVLVLGNMKVKAGSALLHRLSHHAKTLIRNGKRGMPSNHTTDELATLCVFCKAQILLNTGFHFLHSEVTVGHLITGGATHSDLFHALGNGVQGVGDVVGACMVIDAGSGACSDGIE